MLFEAPGFGTSRTLGNAGPSVAEGLEQRGVAPGPIERRTADCRLTNGAGRAPMTRNQWGQGGPI